MIIALRNIRSVFPSRIPRFSRMTPASSISTIVKIGCEELHDS